MTYLAKKAIRWLKRKILMTDYYDCLKERVNQYQKRFPVEPRKTAIRLIWWDFKMLFKYHNIKKFHFFNRKKTEVKQTELNNAKIMGTPLELNKDQLNVGFLLRGGMGDYLVHANYLFKFYKKYCNDILRLDVFSRNNINSAVAIFGDPNDVDTVIKSRPEEGYERYFRDYDLFIDLSRYPDIKRRDLKKIAILMPELIEYIFLCERFRSENARFFTHAGITDGQSAVLHILKGQKRIHQPDIYGFLGVTEEYEYPLGISTCEEEFLEKSGIEDKPFITIHRGCDTKYTENSVKLWPIYYYNILIQKLKRAFPDLLIIQIGVSHDRCPPMEGIDISMVERTTLDQVKVLLKHAVLHIDGEGGMVHLRHALKGGTSIVLFGPTSAEFYGYSENINVVGAGCTTWCEWTVDGWQEGCIRGELIAPCMRSIIPENVYHKVKAFMSEVEGIGR